MSVDADGPAASAAASRRSRPRRWPPTLSAALGIGFAVAGFVIGSRALGDNSFFTHLATGRRILEHGVPDADPYSFTAPGAPWVVQSWLAAVLYAAVDRVGGGAGLRILTGLLAGTAALLAWRLTRPARTIVPRVAIAGLVVAIGGTFWSPRPLLAGLVLLGVTLVVVGERLDPRWLALVGVLWVNLHGSWPLGLVAVGAIAVGQRLDGDADRPTWLALAWLAGGSVVGGVLNPVGPELLVFPVELLGRSDVLSEVVEWQSPSFASWWARLFLVQVLVAVLALVRRGSYQVAVPLVVFVAAALLGLRNIPVASLVLAVGMARSLADLGTLRGRERTPLSAGLAVALVVLGLVTTAATLQRPHFELDSYPTDALAWLDSRGQLGPDARVLTDETAGNLIHLVYGPERQRVAFDDRFDMYPEQVTRDYIALERGRPSWEAILDGQEIDVVVWPRRSPLAALLRADDDWALTYEDPGWLVACRRGSATCDELAAAPVGTPGS